MHTVLTTDHPAWQENTATGHRQRPLRTADGQWLATLTPDGLDLACVDGTEDTKPTLVTTDPTSLPDTVPAALLTGLRGLGPSVRVANPWLWDAITTAVLRQVVRADQARRLYRGWCAAHGTELPAPAPGNGPDSGPGRALRTAPTPETVLTLTDEQFAAVGTTFHRTALRAAAGAYLEHRTRWEQLEAPALAAELVGVPRIGPWTAAAAAADFTGDFSVYPHADLAVRTWAARIAPDHPWPAADKPKKTEALFGAHWHHLAGNAPRHLHTLTLSTLTWGAHARTDQLGGTDPHHP
ncbi:hypothetical protein ACFWJ4_36435 [Kitasatospora sp. NPDC127067]|uniref:hypothetical protein n=1 Tax=Kitasatospora sp. NPDC127067 TaxID=3347126 RepID=UPI00365A3160